MIYSRGRAEATEVVTLHASEGPERIDEHSVLDSEVSV